MASIEIHQVIGAHAIPRASPLPRDAMIFLRWQVLNVPAGEHITHQALEISLGQNSRFTLTVGEKKSEVGFRLPAGTVSEHIRICLRVQISGTNAPVEREVEVAVVSAVVPSPESLTAVYSEQQQEMRRMRTLYETFLVAVTGGFGILVKYAHGLAVDHPLPLYGGISFLAFLICFLVWAVAHRYNRTVICLRNFETALGLRPGSWPDPIMPDHVHFWQKGSRAHAIWACGLIVYTALIAGASIGLIHSSRPRVTPKSASPAPISTSKRST